MPKFCPVLNLHLYLLSVLCAEGCLPGLQQSHFATCQDSPTYLLQLSKSHLSKSPLPSSAAGISVLPAPKKLLVSPSRGVLRLGAHPRLIVQTPSSASRTALEEHFLAKLGAEVVSNSEAAPKVRLLINLDANYSSEAYFLAVTGSEVKIEAATEHGLFYGLMTLRQLLTVSSDSSWSLPMLEIWDAPVYEWRGLMLDVSRHFFPKEDVKRLLHSMALFKMNRFHWHLTDDQGWRFPVAKYPLLVQQGAYRRGSQVGHNDKGDDRVPYNNSYTAEDIDDIVMFATSLHIQVVPEFDLPGHSAAAVAAYPEFGNKDAFDRMPEVATQFLSINPNTLSPDEKAVHFGKEVLDELARLVPSPYLHVGGDEVPTEQWSRSKIATKVALAHHLKPENLEKFMLEQMGAHVTNSLGRTAVVWDEALTSKAKLPAGSVVMLWRHWQGLDTLGNLAAAQDLPVVMAPMGWTYLDYGQEANGNEKFEAKTGFLPLWKVYNMPMSAGRAKVLGGQGQVWSEYISGSDNLDHKVWPRACALAEATWSGASKPGFKDFMRRLRDRVTDLRELKVKFRELDPDGD
mmetsp:Transcript_94852/g.171281  ORF Transcript_94852/g.171281 Transcript_94852/m.171281 type:complete len:572 (+) Transcript_94852:68-1783(+)